MEIVNWHTGTYYGIVYYFVECDDGAIYKLDVDEAKKIINMALKGLKVRSLGKARKNSSHETVVRI